MWERWTSKAMSFLHPKLAVKLWPQASFLIAALLSGDDLLFQQDRAAVHIALLTHEFFQEKTFFFACSYDKSHDDDLGIDDTGALQ